MQQNPFDSADNDITQRVTAGLSKVSLALKSQSWQDAGTAGLSPTQGQILALLSTHDASGMRLSAVAKALGVTAATASDAVTTLVEKALVQKKKAEDDRRAIAITLTPAGQQQAAQAMGWADFLKTAVDELSPDEQVVFLQGLIKIILKLQDQGNITVARMCVTCPYFRPNVYPNPDYPHHCAFVDAPFGDKHLQIDCPDHPLQATGG
ncbi:MAG: MarR family winged helix-turn-helix transcriptional regulator [Elainellaceae cyanobacterium]